VSTIATDQLLKASEVAEMLGISTDHLRVLVEQKKLQSVRLGEHGWHRFRRSDVERLISGKSP
jgi:excisionase family DNA binding protein